jgi:hypothetical protein
MLDDPPGQGGQRRHDAASKGPVKSNSRLEHRGIGVFKGVITKQFVAQASAECLASVLISGAALLLMGQVPRKRATSAGMADRRFASCFE